MKLKPNKTYSFWRVDYIRMKTNIEKYGYIGEILSDSWGQGPEVKDKLLWDEDVNSGDVWRYEDIYPELITFVNETLSSPCYILYIRESSDNDDDAVDYELRCEIIEI